MLLAEARLDTLLEQLRTLPRGDRKAVLARLSPRERGLVRTGLRGAAASEHPSSPWSSDIADRVASGASMTEAGRAALARAAADLTPEWAGAGSLLDALGGLLRRSAT